VDADGALVEFGEIQNLMDGLERVDISGMGGVHFVDVVGIMRQVPRALSRSSTRKFWTFSRPMGADIQQF